MARWHVPHPHLTHRQAMVILWSVLIAFMAIEALVAFHVVHVCDAVEGALVIVGWSREWLGRDRARCTRSAGVSKATEHGPRVLCPVLTLETDSMDSKMLFVLFLSGAALVAFVLAYIGVLS